MGLRQPSTKPREPRFREVLRRLLRRNYGGGRGNAEQTARRTWSKKKDPPFPREVSILWWGWFIQGISMRGVSALDLVNTSSRCSNILQGFFCCYLFFHAICQSELILEGCLYFGQTTFTPRTLVGLPTEPLRFSRPWSSTSNSK
jgi:hypothetical protein